MHSRVPVSVFLVLALAACGGGETPDPQASQELEAPPSEVLTDAPLPFQLTEEQTSGRVVYETMCWSCHGFSGRGDGPAVEAGAVVAPRSLTDDALTSGEIRQLLARFEAQMGTMDPGDPHMANVSSIVDTEALTSALAYLSVLAYPEQIPGSALAGHRNYVLRCQTCHGVTGRGDGPGAEVLSLAPADFTQDTLLAARNFQGAFDKIRAGGGGVHGSSMPAWGVMLNDGDVWDLVAYIGYLQPGVLPAPPSGRR